jgi:hypothetical protein
MITRATKALNKRLTYYVSKSLNAMKNPSVLVNYGKEVIDRDQSLSIIP